MSPATMVGDGVQGEGGGGDVLESGCSCEDSNHLCLCMLFHAFGM